MSTIKLAHARALEAITRVQRQWPKAETTEVEIRKATYSLPLQIVKGRLPTGSTISIMTVVEVAPGKGHA